MEIRAIEDGEIQAFRDALMTTFGDDSDSDPDGAARFRALVEPGRSWAGFDAGTLVATAATFDHEVIVPGGATVPMAGLTMVMVRPTHRRRGILRALVQRHLDDARDRSVPISGLWASEASIYGRFGYGIAAEADAVEIEQANTLVLEVGELDAVDWLDEDRARRVLPAIYARAVARRPGAITRSEVWWRERRFLESPFMRGGASRRRHVVARRGDELVGYVAFRQRGKFADGLPSGKTEIIELLAVDRRAEATLWQFVLQIDLFPTVTWWNAPTDDPLAWMVADPRRVKRRRTDNLWLRIDDVGRVLAARSYEADGALRIAVEDATWELVVENGRARCAPSSRTPDLKLSLASLGALYLGGVQASRLAQANRVNGDPTAIALADRMFASAIASWCPELF